jgi:hypothetical protein
MVCAELRPQMGDECRHTECEHARGDHRPQGDCDLFWHADSIQGVIESSCGTASRETVEWKPLGVGAVMGTDTVHRRPETVVRLNWDVSFYLLRQRETISEFDSKRQMPFRNS